MCIGNRGCFLVIVVVIWYVTGSNQNMVKIRGQSDPECAPKGIYSMANGHSQTEGQCLETMV